MRTWIAIVLLLLIPAAARADSYDDHMKAGDAFEAKSKWNDALNEYEAALVAKPGDAHALVEVGWAACMAGKIARAREASEAALAATTDPKLRGAALFNLGVTYEKDDPFAAASLMFAGYVLRPNATVGTRLAKLEKALGKTRAAKKAGKELLAKLHVDDLPKPSRSGAYHAPIDDALVGALQRAGASFQGIGMSKQQLDVDRVACKDSAGAYTCTLAVDGAKDRSAAGEIAHAIAANLIARGVKGLSTAMQCRLYDAMDEGSDLSCEVPPQ